MKQTAYALCPPLRPTSISLYASLRPLGKNSLRTTFTLPYVLASKSLTVVPEEFTVLDGVEGSTGDVLRLYSLHKTIGRIAASELGLSVWEIVTSSYSQVRDEGGTDGCRYRRMLRPMAPRVCCLL